MEELITFENFLLLSPLFLIQFGLAIFCIVKILKDGVGNLEKWIWLLIVTFGSFIGSIAFLTVGRRGEHS